MELSYANTTSSNENGFAPNGVWKLDTFLVQEEEVLYTCCPNPYVEVHYAFFMKRIGNFYIYSMWIPSGLLSSMIIAVFIMHPNSGEKVSLSVSNVLAFVLFQQIVVGSMPRSGDDSPIIGKHGVSDQGAATLPPWSDDTRVMECNSPRPCSVN